MSNDTSFRLPSALTIPEHIVHQDQKIPLPRQIRDNIRLLFNGLLDVHQAIVSLNTKVKSSSPATTNTVTNVSVSGSTLGGILGKWPGNWIGCNMAASAGSTFNTGNNIGMSLQQISGYPVVAIQPTATQPRGARIQSPLLTQASGVFDQYTNVTPGIIQEWFMKCAINGLTDSRYFWGITDVASNSTPPTYQTTFFSDTPNCNFRFSSVTDTTFKAICQTGSVSSTIVDTGITVDTNPHTFDFVPQSNASSIAFYIDGSLVANISTNIPVTTTLMDTFFTVDGKNSGATTMNFDFYYVYALLTN